MERWEAEYYPSRRSVKPVCIEAEREANKVHEQAERKEASSHLSPVASGRACKMAEELIVS